MRREDEASSSSGKVGQAQSYLQRLEGTFESSMQLPPNVAGQGLQTVLERIRQVEEENALLKAGQRLRQAERENQLLKASQRLLDAEEENLWLKGAQTTSDQDTSLTGKKLKQDCFTDGTNDQNKNSESVETESTRSPVSLTSPLMSIQDKHAQEDSYSRIEQRYADMRTSFMKLQSNYVALSNMVSEDLYPEKTLSADTSPGLIPVTDLRSGSGEISAVTLPSAAVGCNEGMQEVVYLNKLLDKLQKSKSPDINRKCKDAAACQCDTPNRSKEELTSPPTVRKLQEAKVDTQANPNEGTAPLETKDAMSPARESQDALGPADTEDGLPLAEIWTLEDCKQSKLARSASKNGHQGSVQGGTSTSIISGPRCRTPTTATPSVVISRRSTPQSLSGRTSPHMTSSFQPDLKELTALQGHWKRAHDGASMGAIVGNVWFAPDGTPHRFRMVGDIIHMEAPDDAGIACHGLVTDGHLHWSDGAVWESSAQRGPEVGLGRGFPAVICDAAGTAPTKTSNTRRGLKSYSACNSGHEPTTIKLAQSRSSSSGSLRFFNQIGYSQDASGYVSPRTPRTRQERTIPCSQTSSKPVRTASYRSHPSPVTTSRDHRPLGIAPPQSGRSVGSSHRGPVSPRPAPALLAYRTGSKSGHLSPGVGHHLRQVPPAFLRQASSPACGFCQ